LLRKSIAQNYNLKTAAEFGVRQYEMSDITPRAEMEKAIKKIVIPYFREAGFKGSFPHFRKIESDKIKLVTFQFNLSGGSFVVELAQCEAKALITSWGKEILPAKITAHDINSRYRLGSIHSSDHWFVFGTRNYEIGHEKIKSIKHYESVANKVIAYFVAESENYWLNLPNKSLKHRPFGAGQFLSRSFMVLLRKMFP
jgi:hypothetical protein